MKGHISYLKKVLAHKYFVMRGCKQMGVSLWRGILHDWSKFLPVEWFSYVKTFYNKDGSKKDLRRANGGYDPNNTGLVTDFSFAWIHHQQHNKHHWQAWISIGDGEIKENDRICQFRIVKKQEAVIFETVPELRNPNRGGHGSTGKS